MIMDFNQFVREKLSFIDLSQRGFEREMNYGDNDFRDVLKGKKPPRLQDLDRMAEILKLTPPEARLMRELALKAHGYDAIAKELHDLYARVDGLMARVERLEQA